MTCGVPGKTLTDQGPEFVNEVMQQEEDENDDDVDVVAPNGNVNPQNIIRAPRERKQVDRGFHVN